MKSQRKSSFFFIDSLSGGGAERVVSVLGQEFINRGIGVTIVMMRRRPIAYSLPSQIKLIYADELTVTSLYGKLTQRVYSLYNKLRQRGYKPLMVHLGRYNDKPRSNETTFYFYANYALAYRELLKNNPGCTAFGFLIRSNICLLQAARGVREIKTVFCERNNPVRPDMPPHIMKLRDRYYSRADVGVFQTNDEMAYYTRLKGPKLVIPNPIKDDLPNIFQGKRRKEIVNFCRLTEQKRLSLLVDAFHMLLKDYPSFTLRIYGKGDYEDSLRSYIDNQGLSDRVFIESFALNIHERIHDATMFVSTSDFEGLSNSMLEAMAIGLPCVCTDCDGGGARMMIRDHENGLLVPKGDVNAVYRAMKEIIENPGLAQKLSNEAYKIRKELSVDKIVEKWMEVIR